MALGPHDTSPFKPQEQKLPNHVAIIMDGNGRWATEKGLPRTAGHQAGTENIARVLNALQSQSVKYELSMHSQPKTGAGPTQKYQD